MDALVIFKHRSGHAAGQEVSGTGGGRQYHVDEETLLLHLLVGPRKRVAAEAGVSNENDIMEFRAFSSTFREVPPASNDLPPPPPAEVAGTEPEPKPKPSAPPPVPEGTNDVEATGPDDKAPEAGTVYDNPPEPDPEPTVFPSVDTPWTVEQLVHETSIAELEKALDAGAGDHLDFTALADAERNGKDRKGALGAILQRKQLLDTQTELVDDNE